MVLIALRHVLAESKDLHRSHRPRGLAKFQGAKSQKSMWHHWNIPFSILDMSWHVEHCTYTYNYIHINNYIYIIYKIYWDFPDSSCGFREGDTLRFSRIINLELLSPRQIGLWHCDCMWLSFVICKLSQADATKKRQVMVYSLQFISISDLFFVYLIVYLFYERL